MDNQREITEVISTIDYLVSHNHNIQKEIHLMDKETVYDNQTYIEP